MRTKFIIVEPGGDITKAMLSDLENLEDVYVISRPYTIKNRVLSKLKEYHYGLKLNRAVKVPFKKIWNRYSALHNFDFKADTNYYVIFGNASLSAYSYEVLNELKASYNLHYILYYSDPVDAEVARKAKWLSEHIDFNRVFTFDPADSKKYGYHYVNAIYSVPRVDRKCEVKSGLYFVGENKGRLPLINEIYDAARKHEVSTLFRVLRVSDQDERREGIKYNTRISYEQALQETANTDCLLEIVQEGQSGVTLRYYEAVCLNLKLLTNNKTVKNMPYYNPEYMQVVTDFGNVDWEWVKSKKTINYNYQNDFSPIHFIERIKELEGIE